MKRKVLFLCDTNSLHSPMAEALLAQIDSEHFEVMSAGNSKGRPHPIMLQVMSEVGINLSERVCRSLHELEKERFDYVITLDESTSRMFRNVRGTETIQWKFGNPLDEDDDEKQVRAFRTVRDQIAQRLRLFVLVQVRPQEKTYVRAGLPANHHQASLKV